MRFNTCILPLIAIGVYASLHLVWAAAEIVCLAQTFEWLAIEGVNPCI